MYIDNFDTWFNVKKVTSGKGEELEPYRDLFEECWKEAQEPIKELQAEKEELQESLESAQEDLYTADEVDSMRDELKDDIWIDVKTILSDFETAIKNAIQNT